MKAELEVSVLLRFEGTIADAAVPVWISGEAAMRESREEWGVTWLLFHWERR